MKFITGCSDQTMKIAAKVIAQYPDIKVMLLSGDLASGKTTFVKGLGKTLGIEPMKVKSPTFTINKEFTDLIHYDLYRIEEIDEMMKSQLEEHINTGKYLAIEWPDIVLEQITSPHLKITIRHLGKDKREIIVSN